jgi:hypothetical protein
VRTVNSFQGLFLLPHEKTLDSSSLNCSRTFDFPLDFLASGSETEDKSGLDQPSGEVFLAPWSQKTGL